MGTRHLICAVIDGDFKIAQYGQWDGYPDGQGLTILRFLQEVDLEAFKGNLRRCSWITDEELSDQWVEAGAEPYDDYVTVEVSNRMGRLYPAQSRNTGAKILHLVETAPRKLTNSVGFAADSLFCEWAYVLDFDAGVFEVYQGFNKVPSTGRFKDFPTEPNSEYLPITLIQTFSLDDLPSEETFLGALEVEDD